MATFEVQVEGLTGLSIDGSSSPTQDELTEYLKDGVTDITNKIVQLRPQDSELFMNSTGLQVAQGANIDGARVISIVRADGVTAGNFSSCRKISVAKQYDVTDIDSLEYASKYNPAWMMNPDGTVNVFPAPSDNSGKDSYNVYYVNNTPLDGSGTALTYADSNLGYFPADKVYLVIIYAGMKSLVNSLASIDISTFTITAVPPDLPTINPVIFDSLDSDIDTTAPTTSVTQMAASSVYTGSAPTYTPPVVGGDATELSELSILDTDNVIDEHADQHQFDQWFAIAGHFLEDEEDNEMAAAQVQKISAYINAYQQAVANQLQTFNAANAAYQSAIQESVAEFQATNQANLNDAKAALQVAMDNEKRSEARQLQNSIKDMEGIVADNQAKIGLYQASTAGYQAELAAEIQAYQQEIAELSGEYKWKTERLQELKQEYIAAFQLMKPPAQPQQQQGRARR